MEANITLDLSEWTKNARALQETSSRSCVDFINGQSLFVVTQAIKLTIQANRDKIAAALGQTGWKNERVITSGKRAGKIARSGRLVRDAEGSLAWRIIAKRFQDTGEWIVPGRSIADKVRNLISRRARSVSFIRSGWIQAIKQLWSAVKQKPAKTSNSIAGAKQYGQPKGSATPARFRLTGDIVCTVENDIPGHVQGTAPVAINGLSAALKAASANMIAELDRRLKRDLKSFGAQ
jgi:hypothetical protein